MSEKHLWEIFHPYYCKEGNFFKAGMHEIYDSWADFALTTKGKPFGEGGNILYDYDDDLNLVWRWDWKRHDKQEWLSFGGAEEDFVQDELYVYFMQQRKASNMSVVINVTEADEPAVREWLAKKAEHMRKLWQPFL